MYLLIGDKHTANDWGLLLSSIEIGEPSVKTNYVDIPFGDGSIDLSEAITGDVSYGDRVITARFTTITPRSQWLTLFDTIKAYCHGRKRVIKVSDDLNHYYLGRMSVLPLIRGGSSAEFTLDITCEPYKYKNDETVVNLSVVTGGTLTTTLVNSRKRVIPTITVSASTQVVFNGVSTTINAGTHTLTNVLLVEGNNSITFNAVNGTTITVRYQEGVL